MKNKTYTLVLAIALVLLASAFIIGAGCQKETKSEPAVEGVLSTIFSNLRLDNSKTLANIKQMNYSADFHSESYNQFLTLKSSLETSLKSKGYIINSTFSANQGEVTINGQTTIIPAQIQIETKKENSKTNFKIEKISNEKVRIVVTILTTS